MPRGALVITPTTRWVNVSCVKSASATRHAQRKRERQARARANLRSDSAASSRMMSPFSAAARSVGSNEAPGSLGIIARVFRGRRGLARDIGSCGTDNLAGGRPWSRTLVPRISLTPINRPFFLESAFSYVVYE